MAQGASAEFSKFEAWALRFAAADAAGRDGLISEGVVLAKARRAGMRRVIQRDPRRALEWALPERLRQLLPREVLAQMEVRVNARGEFSVASAACEHRSEVSGSCCSEVRLVRLASGERYIASVYGRGLSRRGSSEAHVNGVALEGRIALDERPFRVLEAGESPDPSKPALKVCPVSGTSESVAAMDGSLPVVTAKTPAYEMGGVTYYPCEPAHMALALQKALSADESKVSARMADVSGPQTLLYARLVFPDNLLPNHTEQSAYSQAEEVSKFLSENSFGKVSLKSTVTPVILMPRTSDYYWKSSVTLEPLDKDEQIDKAVNELLPDAMAAIRSAGFDPDAYRHVVMGWNSSGPLRVVGGLSLGGVVFLRGTSFSTFAHELGHNLGLGHADLWEPVLQSSPFGGGYSVAYGNPYDVMGSGSLPAHHFNAYWKQEAGWFRDGNVSNITRSGLYRLTQMDQGVETSESRYALNIVKSASRAYTVEFRQSLPGTGTGANPFVKDGVLINWNRWNPGSFNGSGAGSLLLDTTPASLAHNDDRDDVALVVGRTFSDPESGIHITPIGKAGTTPEAMDVVVNLGAFEGNRAPSLGVLASKSGGPAVTKTIAAAVGELVSFTATAGDPDGDALSFAWDFGDNTFSTQNVPRASRSWSVAGHYLVRCEASDMKGGVTARHVLVTVGAPSKLVVSSRVVGPAGAPLQNVRVSNGKLLDADKKASTLFYRSGLTDADGFFTLTDMAPDTYTLTVYPGGYKESTRSLVLGSQADGQGLELTAAELPVVGVAATVPVVSEGGAGQFTLTRSGPTTSHLDVNVVINGTAFFSDYTLDPAPSPRDADVNKPNRRVFDTLRIPAGSSSLAVNVPAIADATFEGPEDIQLEIAPSENYAVSLADKAAVQITDGGVAPKPFVGIQAVAGTASESGEQGRVRLTRVGDVQGPLAVEWRVSGTAKAGSDYYQVAGTVNFAPGAATADVDVIAIDDSASEGNESVVFEVLASANYTQVPRSSFAEITLLDNDTPSITVQASTAFIQEADVKGAAFVVRRTGDLSRPLTVYYSLGGSAEYGVDYHELSGSILLPAGAASATVPVLPIVDSWGELEEAVQFYVRSHESYQVASPSNAAIAIRDAASLPTLSIAAVAMAAETDRGAFAAGVGKFRISSAGGTQAVTVTYSVSGTAAPGTDFVALPGSVSVPANGSVEVNVTPINNAVANPARTVTATLNASAPGYKVSPASSTATVAILDDDGVYAQVTPVRRDGPASELRSDRFQFWVSRREISSGASIEDEKALMVYFRVKGSAILGEDYVGDFDPNAQGLCSVYIPRETTGVFVTGYALRDALTEGAEYVTLELVDHPTYSVLSREATHAIVDSASLPSALGFTSAGSTVQEAAVTREIPVRLSAAAAGTVTVEYALGKGTALPGVDFEFQRGTLSFAPGELQKTIQIKLLNDAIAENAETVRIELVRATGADVAFASASHTVTITDDDVSPGPIVGFFQSSGSGVESVAQPEIWVTLSQPQSVPVSVSYAVTGGNASSGSDFQPGPGLLTFAPGETAKLLPVTVLNDAVSEPAETLVVGLSSPTGGGATLGAVVSHTYSILDDEALPKVTLAATSPDAAESGEVAGAFTVTRTGSTTAALTVNLVRGGTASNGADYQWIPATVVIPAGASSATVAVSPLGDRLREGAESVELALGGGAAYAVEGAGSATVWIADHVNAAPVFSPIADVNRATPGGAFSISFSVTDDDTLPEDLALEALSSNTGFVPQNLANLELVRNGSNFELKVTPNVGQQGMTMITVLATDTSNAVGSYSFALSVGAQPPRLDQIADVVFNEEAGQRTVALTGIGAGPSNPGAPVSITAKSTNLLLLSEPVVFYTNPAATGSLSFAVQPNQSGTAFIEVTVSNGAGLNGTLTRTFAVRVNSVNDAPQFTPGSDVTVQEDSGPYNGAAWARNIAVGALNEAAQSLRFLVSTDNADLFESAPVVTADGALIFTPAPDAAGVARVSVTLKDDGGRLNGGADVSSPHTLTITVEDVNDAPTLDPLQNVSFREGFAPIATVNLTGISGGPKEADSVSVTAVSSDPAIVPNPTIQYSSPEATGTLVVVPAPGVRGTAAIAVTVDDNRGAANSRVTRSFGVEVGTNFPPAFQAGADVVVNEDAGAQMFPAWATGIGAGGAGEEGQTLSFLVTTDHPELFTVQPTISTGGNLSFTAAPDAFGTALVTVRLRDDGGNLNGGADTSAAQTFTLRVNPVNDAPRFVAGSNVALVRGAGRRTLPWASQIGAGASNESSQALAFEVAVDKPELFLELPSVASNGTLSFRMRETSAEPATVRVRLSDNGGSANGGNDKSPEAVFSIVSKTLAQFAGNYTGLVSPPPGVNRSQLNVGALTLTVRPSGSFTGRIAMGMEAVSFSGVLDESARLRFGRSKSGELPLMWRNSAWLSLSLELDLSGDSEQVTGLVKNGNLVVAGAAADRALYAAKPKAPFRAVPRHLPGNYTVLLTGPSLQGLPAGRGVGRLTVDTAGVAALTATLPDGTALSFSAPLSKENRWPLYRVLPGSVAAVHGWVQFRDRPALSDFDALDAFWVRQVNPRDPRFPAGWPAGVSLEILGSRYTAPVKSPASAVLPGLLPPSAKSNLRLDVSGGGLPAPVNRVFTPAWPYDQRAADYRWKLDRGTGLFTGSVGPAYKPQASFRGVLFQKQDLGAGFFLGKTESGSVSLAPVQP